MRPRVPRIALLTLTALLAGCSGRVAAPGATASLQPPVDPSIAVRKMATPEAAVLAVGSAVDHLDVDAYALLFTDDYEFVFAAVDSAGNAFRSLPLTRLDELQFARSLFVTGHDSLPPAKHARVVFGPLTAQPDTRVGKTFPSHVEFHTVATVSIRTDRGSYDFSTALVFHVVRGDSAQIPPDLAARGFGPDPHRWWIERWEEAATGDSGGSWGLLKRQYLGDPPTVGPSALR